MNPVCRMLIFFIRVYQRLLSPLKMAVFGPSGACRFSPSCSEYTAEALHTHGFLKGAALSAHRLCRCHPWGGSGYDPVPSGDGKISDHSAAGDCGHSRAAAAIARHH
jgi:putative membrane protein insertion efficiency factor